MLPLLAKLLLALAATAPTAPALPAGEVFLTVEEALELAFPGCDVERHKFFLTLEEEERASELAKADVEQRIVYAYEARKDGRLVGTAYFDAHKVRSLKETLMLVVAPDGAIARLELLAFAEPVDYIPVAAWYGQFPGKRLNDDLNLKRDIKGVTGATLTARATTAAARRVLALHAVVQERGAGGSRAGG